MARSVDVIAVKRLLLWASAFRIALILYGAWHDANLEVKYTDIDYDVFSDGARLVWQGISPFERPTYRYTPLLAALLTPNIWLHPAFGKVLFAAADLVAGLQIRSILLGRRVPGKVARACAAAWLLNPLSINVSTRGNSESLVTVLLLGCVQAVLARRALSAGAILAAAVHLKPYPVIHIPAVLAAINGDFAARLCGRANIGPASTGWRCRPRPALRSRVAFLLAFGVVYVALTAACFAWCGQPFIAEALLHHVTRQDARHNFSPYFYALYLAPEGSLIRSALSLLAFVPQAVLLLVLAGATPPSSQALATNPAHASFLLRRPHRSPLPCSSCDLTRCEWSSLAARVGPDLPFCMFTSTVVFVAFNKVCTAQYFIWYHSLLPLVMPSSAAWLRANRAYTVAAAASWVATLAAWLGCAHQLEFRARAVFFPLELASLAFFAANVVRVASRTGPHLHATTGCHFAHAAFVHVLPSSRLIPTRCVLAQAVVHWAIYMHTPTPMFRAGCVAPQACLYELDSETQCGSAAAAAELDGTIASTRRFPSSGYPTRQHGKLRLA